MRIQRISLRAIWSGRLLTSVVVLAMIGLCTIAHAQSAGGLECLYADAQAAKARGDIDGAIEKLKEILKTDPAVAPVYHDLGILYFERGKLNEAAQAFESGLKYDEKMVGSLTPLGMSYYQMGRLDRARDVLEKAVRLQPQDATALLYYGRTLFDLGEQQEGTARLEELSRRSPDDLRALYELGQMHLKMAQGILNKLENTDPDSYPVHLIHAQMMESMENYEGALAQYKKAAEKEPGMPYTHYNVGNVYWRMHKWDEAAGEFKQEIAINPYDCLAYGQLANIVAKTHGDRSRALSYAKTALDLCSNLPQTRMDYGLLLSEGGEYEKAIEQYKHAAELSPEDDGVHLTLGRAYQKLGRNSEAATEFATARGLQKKNSERERRHQEDVGSL